MKRPQGFVLTVQRMVNCKYHLNPPAAIFIYGWRYQARHYCAYDNGLPYLFCLRAPPFTLQLKLLHPYVSFWVTNYKNALQQVLSRRFYLTGDTTSLYPFIRGSLEWWLSELFSANLSSWNQYKYVAFNIFACRILIVLYKMLIITRIYNEKQMN